MKVLILSVTAGYGHISTAKAVEEELISRGIDVLVEDLYQDISKLTYEVIDNGYLFSVNYLQQGYKHAYKQMENSEMTRKLATIFTSNMIIAGRLSRLIAEYSPDCIVCTHPFAGLVINRLKEDGEINIPCIGIITDYCIHPGWEDCDLLEYIVTASELLIYIAIKKNIDPEQIAPLGIPVRKMFRQKNDKLAMREKLGLDLHKKIILIMGGSMGYGNMIDTVSGIDKMDIGLQIVCICGKNEKQRKHLNKLETKSEIIIKGFVDNVHEYMDAVDCIVTKPGGLTVTETLGKELPMILVNPIPGHEQRNIDFLLNNGAAISVTDNFSISEAVFYLFSLEGRLENMRNSIRLIAKPDAGEKIGDLIEKLCQS